MEQVRVFSFGGGVQSTACMVLAARREMDYRTFVFSNVGEDSENPDTLAYIERYVRPYAAAHRLEFLELRKRVYGGPESAAALHVAAQAADPPAVLAAQRDKLQSHLHVRVQDPRHRLTAGAARRQAQTARRQRHGDLDGRGAPLPHAFARAVAGAELSADRSEPQPAGLCGADRLGRAAGAAQEQLLVLPVSPAGAVGGAAR